jgi:uncharacterized protein YciU (UPF0263 family)
MSSASPISGGEELSIYEDYSREVERRLFGVREYLTSANEEFNRKIDGLKVKKTDVQHLELNFDWDSFMLTQKYDSYKVLLNHSTFLTCYSLFEILFKGLCEIVAKEKKFPLRIDDLGGQDIISNCKRYVEKVGNVELENRDADWQQIIQFKKARNKIAHKSKIDVENETDKTFLNFLLSHKSLKMDGNSYYIQDQNFIVEFTELSALYLTSAACALE